MGAELLSLNRALGASHLYVPQINGSPAAPEVLLELRPAQFDLHDVGVVAGMSQVEEGRFHRRVKVIGGMLLGRARYTPAPCRSAKYRDRATARVRTWTSRHNRRSARHCSGFEKPPSR